MAYQYQPFPKTEGLPAIITPKLAAGPKLQTGTLLRPQEEGPSTKLTWKCIRWSSSTFSRKIRPKSSEERGFTQLASIN